MSPKEFARSSTHRWAVIDGESLAVDEFLRWKKLMEEEFPGPHVPMSGVVLDGAWVQCPTCLDASEQGADPGVIECPACKTPMNNPLYVGPGTLPTTSTRS